MQYSQFQFLSFFCGVGIDKIPAYCGIVSLKIYSKSRKHIFSKQVMSSDKINVGPRVSTVP